MGGMLQADRATHNYEVVLASRCYLTHKMMTLARLTDKLFSEFLQ